MNIIIYALIALYALLTGIAGMAKLKETGFQIRLCLFIIVSISTLLILFISNKAWMLILLILAFFLFHVLTVAEGIIANGKLNYRHHIIRFMFHFIVVLMVYKYIK
ncbi:hypothetical protein [Bacillus ndiopicus]|uniref:hypothetical protein n=1 Tax=Bacillus ndiopicus TaxID=1347368 RepID=UPI0005A6F407|nr:hypothetical protein [Bacillus ndiopicus]